MEMSGKRATQTRGRKRLKPRRYRVGGKTFTMDTSGQYYYD
jgi:hypothetical protein